MQRSVCTAAMLAGATLSIGADMASASERKPPPLSAPTDVCYVRVYDAAHLTAHPKQTVTAISVILAYRQGDNEHPFPFTLSVRRRGSPDVARASGDCALRDDDGLERNGAGAEDLLSDAAMRCSAGPAAGGFVLKRVGNTIKALLDLRPLKHVLLEGRCGGRTCSIDLTPGDDDKTFLLERTAKTACRALPAG